MKPVKMYYPWLTLLTGMVIVGLLLFAASDQLNRFYQTPDWLTYQWTSLGLALSFLSIAWAEFRYFDRRRRYADQHYQQLWQSKRQLQNKASTYSGHADKLKYFISERLLEYIEYDEKFLHFRNIAAEVRHNGVISFDKVKTALQLAITLEEQLSQDKESEQQANSGSFRQALDSMQYLWDLLDLATTDNLALHISNQLCECEETYYQQVLTKSDNLPVTVDFEPVDAAEKSLLLMMDHATRSINDDNQILVEGDNRLCGRLTQTDVMLGNPNHIILVLENLFKNAVFFADKKKSNSEYDRVSLDLYQEQGQIRFDVYNPGPHIEDRHKEHLFQLGYSSRRAKGYHGKGLGLFFVHQIVKGYGGKIEFTNIENPTATLDIDYRPAGGKGESDQLSVEMFPDGKGKPACHFFGDIDQHKHVSWTIKHLPATLIITNIEEQSAELQLTTQDDQIFADPFNPLMPQWLIKVIRRDRQSFIRFLPLDIRGVRFSIWLPTANTWMEGGQELDETSLTDLEEDPKFHQDY